jgi:hypothetical protein
MRSGGKVCEPDLHSEPQGLDLNPMWPNRLEGFFPSRLESDDLPLPFLYGGAVRIPASTLSNVLLKNPTKRNLIFAVSLVQEEKP